MKPPAILLVPFLLATTLHGGERPSFGAVPARIELGAPARIAFSTTGGRLALVSLQDATGTEWIAPPGEKHPLWQLALRGPEATTAELASTDVPLSSAAMESGNARFTWTAALGSKQATIHLGIAPGDGTLTRWTLRADVPEGWTVVRAGWPLLPNLRVNAGLKMAAPFGWGLEYDVRPGMSYEGTYPSLVASMPFVAFYAGGRGLYVGMHDATGAHKWIGVKAREDGAAITCMHHPADSETAAGRYAPSFHAVVGTFDGDAWEAAQIYRRFTRETPWGRPSGTQPAESAQRAPRWLRDIDLWLMPGAEPLKNVDACRRAGEFFGVPIALHWYNWHAIPFDTLYPEYLPPKPGFREGVKALQDAGFRVMPYINGRLCDPKSKTWQEGGEAAAARNDKGEPYTEVYGSKVPLNVMCPATPFWQRKVGAIVDRLVNEYGVDGVYIDQITAAHAVRCLRSDHGHAPGGGTFWTAGYRKMLADTRARLPEGRMITSEENAECWNDQFDALLMVNTPSVGGRRIIPLMPAVYAGRVITFGFQYLAGDDVKRSLPFRAKMARCFLYGAQLGWINVDLLMTDDARKEAEFLRNLARARRDAHAWLLDGEFLGEVQASGEMPRLSGEGSAGAGTYPLDVPAVMATAWLAVDGTMALAVVNLGDEPRTVEFKPPWHRLPAVDATRSPPPGENAPARVSITVPERDARVVALRPDQP